jgi:hypothetical protein
MQTLYREKSLLITDEGITIFKYYFPLGQPKTIPWSNIKNIKLERLTLLTGKLRTWGMELKPYWFHLSWRANKDYMFVIDSGAFFKAAITPDNVEAVKRVFEEQGKLLS